MSNGDTIEVKTSKQLPFTAEQVFDAFLDPVSAGEWLFSTPTGLMVKVEISPYVGGHYTIVERRNGEDVAHTGEYTEIDRPRRLTFTFSVTGFSPNQDLVSLDFRQAEGGCHVELTHRILAQFAEFADRTEEGWTKILDGLESSLKRKQNSAKDSVAAAGI
jgi:uncharacterized protein YndB with AHSA1/START domain